MPDVVAELFLFTFLVAVVGRRRAAVVGVGDGVVMVDGRVTVLDAGPDNAPPYVAYDVVGAAHAAAPRVHYAGPADAFDSLVIATDGAVDLSLEEFATAPKYRRNTSLVHKRLRVLSRERCLADDTTVAAIWRSDT
mgnify:FL=1